MPDGFRPTCIDRATYRNFPEHFYCLKRLKIVITGGSVTQFLRKIWEKGDETSAQKPDFSPRPRKS